MSVNWTEADVRDYYKRNGMKLPDGLFGQPDRTPAAGVTTGCRGLRPERGRAPKDFTRQMRKAKAAIKAQPDADNKPFTMWLTLPPSVNGMYYTSQPDEHGKTHRRLTPAARLWKREAERIIEGEALRAGWKMTWHSKVVVEITTWWPDTRRARDPGNLEKALIDSMKGIIFHDDHMALPRCMDFDIDAIRPRVELKIYQKRAEAQEHLNAKIESCTTEE